MASNFRGGLQSLDDVAGIGNALARQPSTFAPWLFGDDPAGRDGQASATDLLTVTRQSSVTGSAGGAVKAAGLYSTGGVNTVEARCAPNYYWIYVGTGADPLGWAYNAAATTPTQGDCTFTVTMGATPRRDPAPPSVGCAGGVASQRFAAAVSTPTTIGMTRAAGYAASAARSRPRRTSTRTVSTTTAAGTPKTVSKSQRLARISKASLVTKARIRRVRGVTTGPVRRRPAKVREEATSETTGRLQQGPRASDRPPPATDLHPAHKAAGRRPQRGPRRARDGSP